MRKSILEALDQCGTLGITGLIDIILQSFDHYDFERLRRCLNSLTLHRAITEEERIVLQERVDAWHTQTPATRVFLFLLLIRGRFLGSAFEYGLDYSPEARSEPYANPDNPPEA